MLGVPQGTVLGPLLFLAYINDIPEAFVHSDSRLFADDCLVYRLVRSDAVADAARLQDDLEALEKWKKLWQMQFHPEKCQVILISHNKHSEGQTEYKLHRHTLEVVDSGKYLGVNISHDLFWHTDLNAATAAKASKTLGFLRRNLSECAKEVKETAYTALVRPTLEYASPAWGPSTSEDVTKLEEVQDKPLVLSITAL